MIDTKKVKRFIHWVADVLKATSDGLETVITKWPSDSPFDNTPQKKNEGEGRVIEPADRKKKQV